MDFSIPAGGMQTADAAFDSAAASISQAFQGGPAGASGQGDTVNLSTAVAGLMKSNLDFIANEKLAIVEDNLTKSSLSVLG